MTTPRPLNTEDALAAVRAILGQPSPTVRQAAQRVEYDLEAMAYVAKMTAPLRLTYRLAAIRRSMTPEAQREFDRWIEYADWEYRQLRELDLPVSNSLLATMARLFDEPAAPEPPPRARWYRIWRRLVG